MSSVNLIWILCGCGYGAIGCKAVLSIRWFKAIGSLTYYEISLNWIIGRDTKQPSIGKQKSQHIDQQLKLSLMIERIVAWNNSIVFSYTQDRHLWGECRAYLHLYRGITDMNIITRAFRKEKKKREI